MTRHRAQEIIDSPRMIDVEYNGEPIYLKSVNTSDTASVHPMGQPNDIQDVPLSQLNEL